MPRRLILILFLTSLTGACSYKIVVPEAPTVDPRSAADHWQYVLSRYVDETGRVDFADLAADPASLHAYVAYIAAYSPTSHPAMFTDHNTRLAYHINAYNALAMFNVIDSGVPESLDGSRKVNFFYIRKFTIGGQTLSLYTYENKVIRAMGDARVHFALNCMVAGCPRLPQIPFEASRLDAQLDSETRRFINEPRNLQVNHETGTVRLSEIFHFFRKDFLKESASLSGYVNRYLSNPIPGDYRIEFIPYDWTINRQPASPASATFCPAEPIADSGQPF